MTALTAGAACRGGAGGLTAHRTPPTATSKGWPPIGPGAGHPMTPDYDG